MLLRTPEQTTYVNKKAVARMLGCTPRTVDRLRKLGVIKASRLGGLVLFNVDDVRHAIEAAREE